MGTGWIFWSINITSVPVFCLLLSPLSPPLVAKSHSFLQFLGGNQHAARVPPIIFHPCLVCAAQKRFLHSRENSFICICGESLGRHLQYDIQHTEQRNGPWPVPEAVLVALTTIYDTWRHTSSAEDRILLLSTNTVMPWTNLWIQQFTIGGGRRLLLLRSHQDRILLYCQNICMLSTNNFTPFESTMNT